METEVSITDDLILEAAAQPKVQTNKKAEVIQVGETDETSDGETVES